MIYHPIPPVFDENSSILILGSFPSVKSREDGFFYAHPQNRFWRVCADVFGDKVPGTTEEKKNFLLLRRIALWDVISACEITGSADSTISHVIPNDIEIIMNAAEIEKIYVNGRQAYGLYNKLTEPKTGKPAVYLPSTSAANASYSLEKLIDAWKIIADETE